MRYVDISSVIVPANWLIQAKAEYGNNYQSLWAFLKTPLESVVGKKCWFSESINIGADNDIEHFRPKGLAIKKLTDRHADLDSVLWSQIDVAARPGYGFLEFEFINYRYCCTFVNSLREGNNKKVRGKANFFPLQLNSPLATSVANITSEVNTLLDPCNVSDPEKLTFTDLGTIEPHISLIQNSWDYCRVMTSIEIYHLHYFRFVDTRKQTWDACREHLEIADELQASLLQTDLVIRYFKYHISAIGKKIEKTSDYSAVSIDCVRFYKKRYLWLQIFFPDVKISK